MSLVYSFIKLLFLCDQLGSWVVQGQNIHIQDFCTCDISVWAPKTIKKKSFTFFPSCFDEHDMDVMDTHHRVTSLALR